MPVSPGASGMQPRDPCRPWRGTLASGHKPRCGLLAMQSLESNPQLSFATRMEDWTCLGQHKRQPEFPVVTRESRRNSRKTTVVVPVLRNPGSRSLSDIAVALGEMVRRAQEGRLLPEDLTGITFTVNNFGADGNLIGTPILNQPEVGILGVGTIQKRPMVVSQDGEDTIAVRWMGYLCLSYDHRVVDGAGAGRFLQALRHTLESFTPGTGIWADPALQAL